MTALSVQYRLIDASEGTTIYDCIADCNDAVAYVRNHAMELDIDPDRIAGWQALSRQKASHIRV